MLTQTGKAYVRPAVKLPHEHNSQIRRRRREHRTSSSMGERGVSTSTVTNILPSTVSCGCWMPSPNRKPLGSCFVRVNNSAAYSRSSFSIACSTLRHRTRVYLHTRAVSSVAGGGRVSSQAKNISRVVQRVLALQDSAQDIRTTGVRCIQNGRHNGDLDASPSCTWSTCNKIVSCSISTASTTTEREPVESVLTSQSHLFPSAATR